MKVHVRMICVACACSLLWMGCTSKPARQNPQETAQQANSAQKTANSDAKRSSDAAEAAPSKAGNTKTAPVAQEGDTSADTPAPFDPKLKPLVGVWQMDLAASVAARPESMRAAAQKQLSSLKVGMVLKDDGTLVLSSTSHDRRDDLPGRYGLIRMEGDTWIVQMQRGARDASDPAAESYTTKMKVKSLGEDRMRFAPIAEEGAPARFAKQNTLVFKKTTQDALDAYLAPDAQPTE